MAGLIEDHMVKVDGVTLHFQVIEGGSPTILLESGGGDDLTSWRDLPANLSRETGSTIISYSRPGFGRSELPEGPCDMRKEASWMWQGLEKLGYINNILLVGLSYGGWMIRLEANDNPWAVSGLVFIDPFTSEFVDILGVEYLDNHPIGRLPFDASDPSKLTKHQKAQVHMIGDGLAPKMEIMRNTVVPDNIPVVIIRSNIPFLPEPRENEAWYTAINQMADSVESSILIIAEESSHIIHFYQPDLIINAVKMVIERSR